MPTMRGVHFAIEDRHLDAIRALSDPGALFDHIGEVIEPEFFQSGFDAETDKAWPLIHQTLVGANPGADDLEQIPSEPLANVIMGEEFLCRADWYLVTLTTAAKVPAVSAALESISREEFQRRLRSLIEVHDCSQIAEEDVEYAGHWFENLKPVFAAAAQQGRHVLFAVDF